MGMSNETGPCVGLLGRMFGHHFVARYTEIQEYPPNTMEGLRATLGAVIADPLHQAWDLITKVCDGYQGMDTNQTLYVHDVCTRCGRVIQERSVTISPEPHEAPQPPAPQPSEPQRAAAVSAPKRVVVVASAQQAAQMITKQAPTVANVPPGAPGSPVRATPGRGPK